MNQCSRTRVILLKWMAHDAINVNKHELKASTNQRLLLCQTRQINLIVYTDELKFVVALLFWS